MSRTNQQTEELKVMDRACSNWMKVAEWASGETASPGIRAIAAMGFEAGWMGRADEIAQLRGDLAGEEALRLEASMSLATALDQITALERAVVEASVARYRSLQSADSVKWFDAVDALIAARAAANGEAR